MSLMRIALRTAVVEALKGRTLAGDNVLDSKIGAIEVTDGLQVGEARPFIAVYTGGQVSEAGEPRNVLHGGGQTDLVLEWGVTSAMGEVHPDGTKQVFPGIPNTDDSLELHNDLIAVQIVRALSAPDSSWAEVFQGLVLQYGVVERTVAASADDGIRLAGQQMRITCEVFDDPVAGEKEPEPLTAFFDLASAAGDPDLAKRVEVMRSLLDASHADHDVVRQYLGLTKEGLLAAGIGPIAGDVDRATPPLSEAAVEVLPMEEGGAS